MSVISLLDVKILNNPAAFHAPYQFEITFESLENLQKDLEWKLTYVGSAQSSEHDQELDSIMVGPIPPGINKFIFEADAPNTSSIPSSEVLGVTVILLTCAYDGREFVRVGYYVNNEYADEALAENPPAKPVIEKIRRNILAEKPRVTRFAIKWDSEATAPAEFPPDQPEVDALPDDEATYGADEEAEIEAAGDAPAEAGPAAAAEAVAVPVVGADGDAEMGDVEMKVDEPVLPADGAAAAADEEDDDAGSEDIEADSSEDEEEDDEGEGEEEMDADEDMDMADDAPADGQKAMPASAEDQKKASPQKQRLADVMVH